MLSKSLSNMTAVVTGHLTRHGITEFDVSACFPYFHLWTPASLPTMDADPWADAPSSSRPSTPAQISSPSDPSKPTFSSPLARDTEHADPSTDDSPPPASRSPSPPAQALASEFPAEDEDPFDSPFEATPAAAAPETSGDTAEDDGFDDFDEFDETAQAGPSGTATAANDDAFGDFGDFEEGDFEEVQAGTGGEVVAEPEPVPEQRWVGLCPRSCETRTVQLMTACSSA